MRPFTVEAAEQVITSLCYGRTEDRYLYGPRRKSADDTGAFRLAAGVNEGTLRLALTDVFDPARYRTTTVADAVRQGLLGPSWEDLVTKLYLNDQDILYMCLLSLEEPVHLRLQEVERLKAYRDQHNDRASAVKFTFMPRPLRSLRMVPLLRKPGAGKQDMTYAHLNRRAKAS
jgi:hypothetical protein